MKFRFPTILGIPAKSVIIRQHVRTESATAGLILTKATGWSLERRLKRVVTDYSAPNA